ncbi:1-aminocyclopropane-1-carboxylate oxidase homolog 3-like protein, partial [Tanacetum coccineum]
MTSPTTENNHYDRETEVKEFDSSKLGVKGLLDTGIKTIPRIFHQPPENLPCKNNPKTTMPKTVPVIDMSQDRSEVVEQVRKMSSTLGFFQVVNHGVDVKMIERVVNDVKKFYEMDDEYKMRFYSREAGKSAAYFTNFDLFHSKAASWRDTLQ